ncbi:MAG TPA: bifunctional UDP-N-acetylmuramoyl-tripeptide:D-alanyl-D-alanine ligase/alanine racemase [Chitinophagales bacterium]|nr:bifunctional UDP-N-acetylmuramoyl-tripeptide:D-alanyl-D-alanine ligase/alanine racemase [Chitinophagales bacterium]
MGAYYTVGQIAGILGAGGQIVSPEAGVGRLFTDSRKLYAGDQGLFIAIRGPHHDGHRYLDEAYRSGIRNFLVSDGGGWQPDANYLLAADTVRALQMLAAFHRQQFAYPVIGITGSNGKTVVKEWIYHLLKTQEDIIRNPRSFNSQTGVPLSVWHMDHHHTLAVFEAGISRPGEMDHLAEVIRPDIGVFTHFGPAHAAGFLSEEEKAEEKAKLFSQAGVVIYRADIKPVRDACCKLAGEQVSWSMDPEVRALWQVTAEAASLHTTMISLTAENDQLRFTVPFTDEASIENAVCAVLTCLQLHADREQLLGQLDTLPVVTMRLELVAGNNGCQLINDAYSADAGSLEAALHFLSRQADETPGQEKIVVLSDMEGSGLAEEQLCRQLAVSLQAAGTDRLFAVGPVLSRHAGVFHPIQVHCFPDTGSLLEQVPAAAFHNAIILVKGARRFRLEKVIEAWASKQHNTVLEIDLQHMAHNLHAYRSLLPEQVRVMAMVKAFGYGSGAAEVAHFLAFNRVDYLAVAYGDEGLELRRHGVHLPVMVMNPDPQKVGALIDAELEPEVFSLPQLQAVIQAAADREVRIHIELDTGMNRLGFREEEFADMIRLIRASQRVNPVSIFTHLSAADMPEEDAWSRQQIALFDRWSDSLMQELDRPVLRHVLNSPGIARFPEAAYDMVRLGIGLYGDDPSEELQRKLLPVSSWFTTVAQVRKVEAGESIGYGRQYRAKEPMVLAVLNIGYADGFRRSLGNGVGRVWLHGDYAPVVGRVCMDMCMVDVTHLPDVRPGDKAEVMGTHQTLRQLAEAMKTIPYEVLTGISHRVKRIYQEE